MMKYLVCSFILIALALCVSAQDVLFYKSDEQKKVKVIAIDNANRTITYKSWDNLTGPDYKESIAVLRKVIYENGTSYTFDETDSGTNWEEKNAGVPTRASSGNVSNNAMFSAPEDKEDDYFSISAGASFPLGEYASEDVYDEYTFLAQPGAGFQLDFGFLFGQRKIAGLGVNLGYQFHSVDYGTMLDFYQQFIGNPFLRLTVGKLHHVYNGIGPVVRIPFKVGSIDIRFLVGTDISVVSSLVLTDGSYTVTQESAVKTGVMVSPGIGMQFNVAERIFIPVRLDYMYSQTHFTRVRIYSSAGDFDYISFDQKANMLLISTGLGVNF